MKKEQMQFKSVKASVEMEGYTVSKELEDLILKEANGEISFEEFSKQILKSAHANE